MTDRFARIRPRDKSLSGGDLCFLVAVYSLAAPGQ